MPVTKDDFKFFYGMLVNNSQDAGSYATTITYTVVGNEPPPPPTPGWVKSDTSLSGATASSIQVDKDSHLIPVVYRDAYNNTPNSWCDYDAKQWCNAVIVDSSKYSEYDAASLGTLIPMEDILAFYVYVPRYAYEVMRFALADPPITSPQLFDISFQTTSDPINVPTGVGQLATHPAFDFGGTALNGIWVGKFDTGSANNISLSSPLTNGSAASDVLIKPDAYALSNMDASSMFATGQNLKTQYNLDSTTDSRILKNSDWGAVAYLTTSVYGYGTDELKAGNCTDMDFFDPFGKEMYIKTGYGSVDSDGGAIVNEYIANGNLDNYCSDPDNKYDGVNGLASSSTGNIYGIYDLNGGAMEYVAANYDNIVQDAGFAVMPDAKYYDLYPSPPFKAESEPGGGSRANYDNCTWGYCGGHALYEVITEYPASGSEWGDDVARFTYDGQPWFVRGGFAIGDPSAGLWTSYFWRGGYEDNMYYGFRSLQSSF
jgi:hypothetical protein